MTAESAGFKTILGVDCATVPKNVGLARARLRDGDWHLTETRVCSVAEPPADVLARWIEQDGDCLLALDAPLGWPAPLSRELASHTAGNAIHTPADEMFSRTTDRFVKRVYKKHPLEVGAARIARTARATLLLLDELRRVTGLNIPLAWGPDEASNVAAIEVYPAVTRKVHLEAAGIVPSNDSRADIIALVGRTLAGHHAHRLEDATAHELDATLCIVAGRDFLAGSAAPPDDLDLAKREGWIWVRKPHDVSKRAEFR